MIIIRVLSIPELLEISEIEGGVILPFDKDLMDTEYSYSYLDYRDLRVAGMTFTEYNGTHFDSDAVVVTYEDEDYLIPLWAYEVIKEE